MSFLTFDKFSINITKIFRENTGCEKLESFKVFLTKDSMNIAFRQYC